MEYRSSHHKSLHISDNQIRKLNKSQDKGDTLEQQMLECFLVAYRNKENLRVQRNMNSLNHQIQRLKNECMSGNIKSSQILQQSRLQVDNTSGVKDETQKPLVTLHKKLQAIERCWIDNGSTRKGKRKPNRFESRSKTNSFYQGQTQQDFENISINCETPKQPSDFIPFQFYNFRNGENRDHLSTIISDCDGQDHSELESKVQNQQMTINQLKQIIDNQSREKQEMQDQLKEMRKLNNKLQKEISQQKQEETDRLGAERQNLTDLQDKLKRERYELESLKNHLNQRELELNQQQERQIQEFQKIKLTIKELKKEIVQKQPQN